MALLVFLATPTPTWSITTKVHCGFRGTMKYFIQQSHFFLPYLFFSNQADTTALSTLTLIISTLLFYKSQGFSKNFLSFLLWDILHHATR